MDGARAFARLIMGGGWDAPTIITIPSETQKIWH